MQQKTLFYDCKIVKCVPPKYGFLDNDYQYCDGWHDKEGMGIACICVYADWLGYRVFLANQLEEFQAIASEADEIVGFNSIDFDDKLLAAHGIEINTTYDLLCEVRVASGQPPFYQKGVTRRGYSLELCSYSNLNRLKTLNGEDVPKLWQNGEFAKVIKYCFNDLDLLKEMYDRRSNFIDPTNYKILFLRGGSRLKFLKEKWNRSVNAIANDCYSYLKNWQRFFWAIPRCHPSHYSIDIVSPIKISFQRPSFTPWISYSAWNAFERKSKTNDNDKKRLFKDLSEECPPF